MGFGQPVAEKRQAHFVIPAKAGIRDSNGTLDSRFRWSDGFTEFFSNRLMRRPAAVDQKDMARDQVRGLRGEIDRGPDDIFRLSNAAQGNISHYIIPEILILKHGPGQGSLDER